jgi:phosphate starvation-inducible PhoH-like protein
VKGIAFIEMNKKDIVRHKLVTKIVEAYEKFDKALREERDAAKEASAGDSPKKKATAKEKNNQ